MGIIDFRPGNSFMHNMDPRVKVLALLGFSVVVFVCENLFVVAAMCISFIVMWNIVKLPFADLKKFVKVVTAMMTFIICLQIVFYGDPETASWMYIGDVKLMIPEDVAVVGGWGLKWDGLWFGLLLSVRFYALIILLPMVVKTTRLDLFSLALIKIGLSYKIAYMATTALNMIPTFSDEIATIQEAQKMRGQTVFDNGGLWAKIKGWVSLVVPLVIGAMRRAQQMGVAMDTRAFGAYPTRTCITEITMKKSDWAFAAMFIVMAIAFLVGNFTLPNLF